MATNTVFSRWTKRLGRLFWRLCDTNGVTVAGQNIYPCSDWRQLDKLTCVRLQTKAHCVESMNKKKSMKSTDMETRSPTARAKFLYLQLVAPEKVDFTKRKPTDEIRPLTQHEAHEPSPEKHFTTTREPFEDHESQFQDDEPEEMYDVPTYSRPMPRKPQRRMTRSKKATKERRSLSKWITHADDTQYNSHPAEKLGLEVYTQDSTSIELDRRIASVALQLRKQELGSRGDRGLQYDVENDEDDDEEDRLMMATMRHGERRKLLRERRRRHAEEKMGQLVHTGRMPWKMMLDEEVARDVETDIGIQYGNRAVDEDPDAYDTDELLSDVSDVSSTDSENDTPEKERRRERHRRRIRRLKTRALRKRKREAKRKRKETIERAQHRYYDEMIQEICSEYPNLRDQAPRANADLEAKRSFIDRGQAEIMTQQKIDEMRQYISFGATGLEAITSATKFPRLQGLSSQIDEEINRPHARPLVAQMARKHLRQGAGSPEMALVRLGLTLIVKQHMQNMSNDAGSSGSNTKFGVLGTLLQKGATMLGLSTPAKPPPVPASTPTPTTQPTISAATGASPALEPTRTETSTRPSPTPPPLPRRRYFMDSSTPYPTSRTEPEHEESAEDVHDTSGHM